jgi:hypothetical protein
MLEFMLAIHSQNPPIEVQKKTVLAEWEGGGSGQGEARKLRASILSDQKT